MVMISQGFFPDTRPASPLAYDPCVREAQSLRRQTANNRKYTQSSATE